MVKRTDIFNCMSKVVMSMSKVVMKLKNFGKESGKNRIAIAILAVLMISILSVFFYNYNTAYSVKVNGKSVGIVREKTDFTQVVDSLKDSLDQAYAAEVVFNEIIEYSKVRAKKSEIYSVTQLERNLKQALDIKIKAFAIKADEKIISVLSTKAEAEKVLEGIKKPYIVDQDDIAEVYFSENVVVEEIPVEVNSLKSFEDTMKLIQQGTNEIKVHEVQEGESFWTIAKKYDIDVEDLEKANPGINADKVQIKQPINLIVPKPLLTVVTVRRSRYEDSLPFPIEFEETAALYQGEKKIKVSGKDGKQEVYVEILKHNGIEVSRVVLEEKIIQEPSKQIVLKGTKVPPPKIGTGTFGNPTRGMLTSRFGSRWGRRHEGIDIAARTGTPVNAADGGKIIFSGTSGNYGKLVKINHGGGYVTYYAHNSKLLVSEGDKVFKGQKIAEVGSTGRSTGPHLHFEVRKNGKPVNPLSYVNY